MEIRTARRSEHETLCRIARSSSRTKAFSSHFFSSEIAYAKGWIRVAIEGGMIVGYTCVRQKVRLPETVLYFVTVSPDYRGRGVGEALVRDVEERSEHGRVVLKLARNNKRARPFYLRLGYEVLGGDEKYEILRKECPR